MLLKNSVPLSILQIVQLTHYGPDTVGHIRNIERMRPREKTSTKFTWTENQRKEPGHRRPQDQALEAGMNCSVKNDFKVGTPTNVINRSATVQERSNTESNLKQELGISKGKTKATL